MKCVKIYLQTAIIVPFLLMVSCQKEVDYSDDNNCHVLGGDGEIVSWMDVVEIYGHDLFFSYIEGGTFYMGAQNADPQGINYDSLACDDTPVHVETVRDFYLCQNEVTQGLWEAVMGSNPSYFNYGNPDFPVENVSYEEVLAFIDKINEIGICEFRLPTEAEWEFAARGGLLGGLCCEPEQEAWIKSNSSETTHLVKKKLMNYLGLFDMKGNVWEYCSNSYGSYGKSDTIVTRGGSWNDDTSKANVFYRGHYADPTHNDIYTGFRLAVTKRN